MTTAFATELSTLTLNGYTFKNFADGDYLELTAPNPATGRVRGQGSVSIIKRADAAVRQLTIRIMKLGEDDVFLNSQLNQSFPVVFAGSLVTNFQTQAGEQGIETWSLEGGSITTQPTDTRNNTDNNAMLEYVIEFNDTIRMI